MPQFTIRQYTETDISSIIYLFRLSFQKEISEQWFRWKYQHSPFCSKGYVAADGDRVVAFYGGLKLQFLFHGECLRAYQLCDVMTHPDYRGRLVSKTPLIVQLGEMFYRENPMDFAFGFPSLRHARLQSLRLGGEGYRLVRIYKKERLGSHSIMWKLKVSEGWEFFKKEELDRFCDIKGQTVPSPLAVMTRRGEGKGEGNAILRFIKDERYIQWRYRENPSKKYHLLIFRRMNRTKGYIIFSVEDGWLNILEIFHKDDKDIQDIMIALESHVVRNITSIKGIRFWLHPMEPQKNDMEKLGYSGEDSIPIAFKSVDTACGVTSDIFYDGYFYRMGDYDAS
jgi:hypothetical protein